jgi:hypothetical protein
MDLPAGDMSSEWALADSSDVEADEFKAQACPSRGKAVEYAVMTDQTFGWMR